MRALALSAAVLSAGLLSTQTARADLLVGLTTNSGLTGVNIEFVGEPGSAYIVLGSYVSGTGYEPENITGIIGVRRYMGGKHDQSTYFGGVYAGDIDGGPGYNRFGAGGEIGYQWVTAHLRMTLHAGMGLAGEGTGDGAPAGDDIEPVPQLGASISLRF